MLRRLTAMTTHYQFTCAPENLTALAWRGGNDVGKLAGELF
jgi:hypothetical protein